MYLVYQPFKPDDPEVLPEVLTPSIMIDGLRRAGPSKLADKPVPSDVTLTSPPTKTVRAGH